MKIRFITDNNIRKLLFISNLFGPPDSIGNKAKLYAQFLGKNFYTASIINDLMPYSEKRKKSFWSFFLYDRVFDKNVIKVKKLLSELDIIMLGSNDVLFKRIEEKTNRKLVSIEKEMVPLLWTVFRLKLPREINMIITEVYDKYQSFGEAMCSDPPLIGLSFYYRNINRQIDHRIAVLLHEILHLFIEDSGIISSVAVKNHQYCTFAEALIQYFVPDGILSGRLGLAKLSSADKVFEMYSGSNFSKELKELLPIINEYDKVFGNITIWEFLEKHGFSKMINKRALKKLML